MLTPDTASDSDRAVGLGGGASNKVWLTQRQIPFLEGRATLMNRQRGSGLKIVH